MSFHRAIILLPYGSKTPTTANKKNVSAGVQHTVYALDRAKHTENVSQYNVLTVIETSVCVCVSVCPELLQSLPVRLIKLTLSNTLQ